MSTTLAIAIHEWRYWSRTRLATVVALVAFLLIVVSVFATFGQVAKEKATREGLQVKAEETFRNQPARHPHRMVHYGHYVFRTPTPLSVLDPGVDPFTGTVLYLEGHRQNSATFSSHYDGAQAGAFARLSPAFAYQLLVPLVLIVMGFGVVSREREACTDHQLVTSGISPISIWFGKTLALGSVALLLLLPMLIGVFMSGSDSNGNIEFGFSALYILYLMLWVLIITAVSTWSQSTSNSLLILLAIWLVLCILIPRLMASAANTAVTNASQIETDIDVIIALRSIGDGHNANDPAFNQLRNSLLKEYGVEKIEDLPVNFRGVVAQAAEADLTDVLNTYAEKRMTSQVNQTEFVKSYEIMSPFIVLQSGSMIAAGTDGRTHHRFLREAEAVRFEFVQSLNKVHEQKMTYTDDLNRSKDVKAERRTRVDPANWRILKDFRFEADPAETRLKRLLTSFLSLLIWMMIFAFAGILGTRRLPEVNHG